MSWRGEALSLSCWSVEGLVVSSSPFVVIITDQDRRVLLARARGSAVAHREVVRARIVLGAADGASNVAIAARLGVHVDTVSTWRARYARHGLAGLGDAPRSGRPRVFSAEVVSQVKAMACEAPRDRGAAISRWSSAELAVQAVTEGLVKALSPATVARWLATDAIKPWQVRSWISPRAPDFAVRGGRVLDLYARRFEGQDLGGDEYVISADEKSQLQALRRVHPDVLPGPGRVRRTEFEYVRGGTLAYLAGYDVHRARVVGHIAPSTGIVPFTELVEKVMTAEPYASAARVFWVVDNGSSHNGTRSIERMRAAWPTAQLVHTPVHASWLNQIEVFFSIVQRKVITPGDFEDLTALAAAITAFEPRYNTTAVPFDWRYTRADLHATLARLAEHEPAPGTVSSTVAAAA